VGSGGGEGCEREVVEGGGGRVVRRVWRSDENEGGREWKSIGGGCRSEGRGGGGRMGGEGQESTSRGSGRGRQMGDRRE